MSRDREPGSERESGHAGADDGVRRLPATERDRCRLLEAIVENANDAVLVTDAAFDRPGPFIVYVNPAYSTITGYTPEESLGYSPRFLQGVDTDPAALERIRVALEHGESVREELLNYRRDGTPFWVDISIVPVRDEHGRVTHFASVQRDTTARRRAEQDIAHLRHRLETILNNAAEGIYGLDTEGRTTFANPAAARMVGRSPEELLGERQHDLIHHSRPDGSPYPADACPIYAAYRDGEVHRVDDEVFWRRDGTSFPVEYVSAPIRDNGRIAGAVVTFRDISERRRAEEAQRFLLEASRTLSASLEIELTLRGVTELVIPERADYCIVHLVNDAGVVRTAAAAHRDPDRTDLVRRAADVMPAADTGAIARALRSGESELVTVVSDAWLRTASRNADDRRVLDMLDSRSIMVVPLRVRERVIGTATVGMTEPGRSFSHEDLILADELCGRLALALENARLFRDAQQATRVRDEVLRIVAHDLRNPLNTILLSAGVLGEFVGLEAGTSPAEQKQIDVIRRSAHRADRLIQDLLDVARVEAGRLAVETAPQPAAELVREAVELHGALADEKRIRLEADVPTDLPSIDVDRDRVLQVFSNLIENAIRFTPEGGRVTVRAERRDGEIVFSVEDTGPGIPAEQRAHVFDPFWQAERTGRAGAGLGLAIARGIVEAHGGWIQADSEVGRGTTMRFGVPVSARRHRDAA